MQGLVNDPQLRVDLDDQVEPIAILAGNDGTSQGEPARTMWRATIRATANRTALPAATIQGIGQVFARGQARQNLYTVQRVGLARIVAAGQDGNCVDGQRRTAERLKCLKSHLAQR